MGASMFRRLSSPCVLLFILVISLHRETHAKADVVPTTMRTLQALPSPGPPDNDSNDTNSDSAGGSHDDLLSGLNQFMCEVERTNETIAMKELGVPFCGASRDPFLCWPPTEAGSNISLDCPPDTLPGQATRICLATGEWASYTRYDACWDPELPDPPEIPTLELGLRYVYLVGITLSIVLLLITLFIFWYFKALQCTRIAIHKNLVVSFIFKYIAMIVWLHPTLTDDYMRSIDVTAKDAGKDGGNSPYDTAFCHFSLVLIEYFSMSNMFWMLVEGLYLTSRIAIAVFSTESNFKVYLAIGWASPLLFVIPWTVTMAYRSDMPCWHDHLELAYIWILRAPLTAVILVNTLFLINIIRILITKLRASHTMETNQMRKAVKAVAVLFPLLGLTNLIFFWSPESDNEKVHEAFLVINAVLQSTQGVFVAVIYCFLNAEVRKLVKRKVLASLDEYGKRTPRRSNQYHTTNGSCGVPTTSEVVMASSYRSRSHLDHSTTIAEHDQHDQCCTEMKPLSPTTCPETPENADS